MPVKRRDRSLRWHLAVFALALTLPLYCFLALTLWTFALDEQAQIEASAVKAALLLSRSMDQRADRMVSILEMAANSDTLRQRDFQRFSAKLENILSKTGSRLTLRDANGVVIAAPAVNQSDPSLSADNRTPPSKATDGLEYTSFFSPTPGDMGAAQINLVLRDAGLSGFKLSMTQASEDIASAIVLAAIPPNWMAAIYDAEGRVLARSPESDGVTNAPVLNAMTQGGFTRDGASEWVSRARSDVTGWSVAVRVPNAELQAPFRSTVTFLAGIGTLLGAISFLMAYPIGNRIAAGVDALRRISSQLERGATLDVTRSKVKVDEIGAVLRGLAFASSGIRRGEADLADSRERLHGILDTTPCGIFEVSRNGTLTYANRLFEDFVHYPNGQIIGVSLDDLSSSRASVEGDENPASMPPVARALNGERAFGSEQSIIWKSGRRMDLSVNAVPVRSRSGEIVGALVAVSDITERMEADRARRLVESRLRTILDTVPVGIILAEAPTGRIIEGNDAVVTVLRHPVIYSADIEHYRDWHAFHGDGRLVESAEYPLSLALLGKEERPELECNYQRGDGSFAWVKIVGAPLRNEDGFIVGAVVAVVDIDDLKRSQSQQLLMNRELHHRVKNTLATVQGIANLTARSATNIEDFRRTLANRIVSLSRTHTLLVENSWEKISLRELLDAELNPFRTAENDQVSIDGVDLQLRSELALALGMAIHEMTTNAAKFGALSTNAGRLTVTWKVEDFDGTPMMVFDWVESGGPDVVEPKKVGFGSRLLTDILARQLKGRVNVDYQEAGIKIQILSEI